MIAPMTDADLPAVVALYAAANTFVRQERILAWTRENLRSHPGLCLVYRDPDVIGAVSGYLRGSVGVIDDIAIARDRRRSGIGHFLLTDAMRRYERAGARSLELVVHEDNVAAIPFYERHGFSVIRERLTRDDADIPDGERITEMRFAYPPRLRQRTASA